MIAVVINLLLTLLPQLLKWLFSLEQKGKKISGKQLEQLNHIAWYTGQISRTSAQVGCVSGGVNPEV